MGTIPADQVGPLAVGAAIVLLVAYRPVTRSPRLFTVWLVGLAAVAVRCMPRDGVGGGIRWTFPDGVSMAPYVALGVLVLAAVATSLCRAVIGR
jgi:hypothetical protein